MYIMKSYTCKPCNYFTYNKRDFDKHIKTLKHQANYSDAVVISSTKPTTIESMPVECIECHDYL